MIYGNGTNAFAVLTLICVMFKESF